MFISGKDLSPRSKFVFANLTFFSHPSFQNFRVRPDLKLLLVIIFLYLYAGSLNIAYANLNEPHSIENEILTLFPRATRPPELDPETQIWSVYQLNEIIGYAYESNHFVDFKGFSGERINILIGLDIDGRFSDLKILHHHEPIFLHGLGPKPLKAFLEQYPQHTLSERIMFGGRKTGQKEDRRNTYFDGVTKATVSIIVINDTILSSAREVARRVLPAFAQQAPASVRTELFKELNWQELLNLEFVKHWSLGISDFEDQLGQSLSSYPSEQLDLSYDHTQIYYAYLNAPSIGRNLLGDADYAKLIAKLSDGEQAILIMSEGFYDYLGEEFRPGTIPERISLEQHNLPITLRDINFFDSSMATLPKGAPDLDNLRIFKIRPQAGFDPSAAMQMVLSIKLDRNHLVHDNIIVKSEYQLPSELFNKIDTANISKPEAMWVKIWKGRLPDIAILTLSLIILSIAFIMQRRLVMNSRRFLWFRRGFLLFTLMYIGFYAQGQLSIVNLIALLVGALNGFDIHVFLLDPIIFILLSYTTLSLILWGRGLFCGWLCPFGVMQEFLANIAAKFNITQWNIRPNIHQRLLKLKYFILVALLVLAPYSLTAAEKMAEIEPFKTAVTLAFIREWPFVIYAVIILGLGLFVHKFYCRYLCPLGAALAIMGKFHRFKWLDRRQECGTPCQLCKHRCGVDAIKKAGDIDYEECIQCLECVVILQDPQQCAATMSANKKAKRHTPEVIEPVRIVQGK
jgi:NosR/NirI family nitrous oxide reductase transcriptional regulator